MDSSRMIPDQARPVIPIPFQAKFRVILYACAATVLLFVLHLVFLLFAQDDQVREVSSNLLSSLISLLMVFVILQVAHQFKKISRVFFLFWLLIGIGQLMNVLGEFTWTIFESVLKIEPYPSLADLFYLLSYPIIAAGLLMLPGIPPTNEAWSKTVIDIAITVFTSMIVFWNFLLGPLVTLGHEQDFLTLALSLAYPVADLILLVVVIIMLYRLPRLGNSSPLWVVAGAMFITITADTIFSYQAMSDTYISGGMLDILWTMGYLFMTLAAVSSLSAFYDHPDEVLNSKKEPGTLSHILYFLPNIWIVAAFALLLDLENPNTPLKSLDLAYFVGAIILLVVFRQWISLSEAERISRRLKAALDRVQQQSEELEQANAEMQIEIQERRRAEERLWHDALHDSLTGLPNRSLLLDRMAHAREKSARNSAQIDAVLFLDLDSFKLVNDSLGHPAGDQLLVKVAEILQRNVRSTDTVARIGGDEFAILLEGMNRENEWEIIAGRIQNDLANPIDLDTQRVFVSASIGVIPNASLYQRGEDVLRDADLAMYQAKLNGKARYEMFQESMHRQIRNRLNLESDLRSAIENNELILHYQPVFRLPEVKLDGVEALVRWPHPSRGLVAPGEFIPIAENNGLILPLGRQILRMACEQAACWRRKFPGRLFQMRVNISSLQFAQPDFIDQVAQILLETGLPTEYLVLEVTETTALQQPENIVRMLKILRELGIKTEIDDFGTGYSSLSYLHQLPVHAIKVDRSFIHNIIDQDSIPETVRAIIALASSLGIESVAEGIETPLQLEVLKDLGCNYAQGFHLSPPLTSDETEKNFLTLL